MRILGLWLSFVAALMIAVPAVAGPTMHIIFDNQSGLTVTSLKIRIAGSKDWGAERLTSAHLAPHSKIVVPLIDGIDKCVVEIELTASDGKSRDVLVSLCQDRKFVFYGAT